MDDEPKAGDGSREGARDIPNRTPTYIEIDEGSDTSQEEESVQ